ncbi:hypothetical protein 2.12 [Burkholderia phage Bups phi1]|nr:hypothetical protein 2.12 [Burkholderia phage Bups phi1]
MLHAQLSLVTPREYEPPPVRAVRSAGYVIRRRLASRPSL